MFTVVIIGNTQSYSFDGHFITPRRLYDEGTLDKDAKIGQAIMIESFRTINSELANPNIPLDHKWALIHSIHTTADFDMEKTLYSDPGAVSSIYQAMLDGKFDTIITDVTMVARVSARACWSVLACRSSATSTILARRSLPT